MTQTIVEMKLTKPAANKGGDRYEGRCCDENLVVYLPQALTRMEGKPVPSITLTIS